MKKRCVSGICNICALVLIVFFLSGCVSGHSLEVFKSDDKTVFSDKKQTTSADSDRFRLEMVNPETIVLPPLSGPLSVSIEDVTVLALDKNSELQVKKLNPIIAGTFEKIERGEYDPEVFAQFEYTKEKASETSRATGEQFNVEVTDTSAVVGLRQEVPTGTRIEISAAHEKNKSNRAPDQENARVGISITQALLRGFGPAVNLVSVRQAQLETLASIYELRGFSETLVAETEIAYWHYVLSLEEMSIYESSLAIAKQQLSEVFQQIEVGILPEIEAAAARAEVARREQALIDAKSLMEERRLNLLGLIVSSDTHQLDRRILTKSKPWIDPEPINDLKDRLALARKSRPDLGEAELRLNQGRLDIVATKNGMLPKLDLFLELGRTGFADNLSDSFGNLDKNTYDFTAGLQMSRYLGNRMAEAHHEAALAGYQQKEKAVENLRRTIALDVRLAVNNVEKNRLQISASKATRILEEETLSAEKERFKVGTSTAIMVAQAQRDLLASQIAEIRSVINYRISLVRLYLAEGSLLKRRGIIIGDTEFDSE